MRTSLAKANHYIKMSAFFCFQTNRSVLIQPIINFNKRMVEIDYILMWFTHKKPYINLKKKKKKHSFVILPKSQLYYFGK